jgi:hypothetical protein
MPADGDNAGAGSAITTRICGAEQCGQKATPSSTACPHLWQSCSIGAQAREKANKGLP